MSNQADLKAAIPQPVTVGKVVLVHYGDPSARRKIFILE